MARPFTSFRHPFAVDAALGRLAQEPSYERHVDQLLRQLLLTAPGERINRPDFGCGLRRMLFAPNSAVAATLAQVSVRQAIDRWLGSLVVVDAVTVHAAHERLDVHVAYTLKARGERRYLNLQVAA